jgi:hypothetical protein
MKHYRIIEEKKNKKIYTIQYLKKFIFGLYYWVSLNKVIYYKYEEALNEVKRILKIEDYENEFLGYHYIDAYKIFKNDINKLSGAGSDC